VDANGTPTLFPCVVLCTREQYDEGDHYEGARAASLDAKYENPQHVHDDRDGPAFLFRHFRNEFGTVIDIREDA
jgi:hypothetical protein